MNRGFIYAALAYIAWGLFPAYFHQIVGVSALEVVLHRTLWALLFLLLVLAVLKRWAWLGAALRRPKVVAACGLSALLLSSNWLIYVWAIQNGHVLDTSLGYFILPLVNVAIGFFILGERIRRGQWLAVSLAALGVLWLALQAHHVPWLALALALTFGFYGLLRKVAVLGAIEGLALETLLLAPIAAAALTYVVASRGGTVLPTDSHTTLWLVMAGPITAVPLMLFAAGARRITLTAMGVMQYISPSLQFMLAVWLFHEPFAYAQLVGFALIWTALLIYTLEGWWFVRQNAALAPSHS